MNRLPYVACVILACACKTVPEASGTTTSTTATVTTPSVSATATPTVASGPDVTWTMPSGWSSEPTVGMRKATYRIAKAAGDAEDATVSVIQAGGTVDDNVSRWKEQFDAPHDFSRSESTISNLKITMVEVHGTYTGGGVMVGESPNPRPGWALRGAIVSAGPQPYFFKMLGPDKTVAAARQDFQALVDSIHPK